MMHTYLATPRARRWIAQNQKRKVSRGEVLVFVTALVLLALWLGGVL